MKKNLLVIGALLGLALGCQALTMTEAIILSKGMETSPISLVQETSPAAACLRPPEAFSRNQLGGAGKITLKALKNIGSFLIKGLCGLAQAERQNPWAASCAKEHGYDRRAFACGQSVIILR